MEKLLGSSAKVVEAEGKKVGAATGSILTDLKKLFLQNNFLFRQMGQRVAGDAGFIGVGLGKLGFNLKDLIVAEGGAAAGATTLADAMSALGFLVNPVTAGLVLATAAVVGLGVASVASAAGLFFLAKGTSDAEEKFADLSQQTGLSVQNLQILDIAGRRSHTTIDRLQASVGQLERKLIDASEGGTSRMSQGLKKLGIDLEDPNKALSQIVDLLAKLPAGTVRTGAAIQIFGRAGKDAAGAIGEMVDQVGTADGVLDRFRAKQEGKGIHILSPDEIKLADDFNTKLKDLTDQIETIIHVAGVEALPVILDATTRFSNWIIRNKAEIADWTKSIVHLLEKLATLGFELINLTRVPPILIPITIVKKIIDELGPTVNEVLTGSGKQSDSAFEASIASLDKERQAELRAERARQRMEEARARLAAQPEQVLARGSFSRDATAAKSAEETAKKIRDAFAQRPKGAKGEDPAQIARRLAEIELQEVLKGLQAEHDALDRQLDLNRISREKYTQDAINLELKRRQETIDGLKKELAEAENIRKPGQRAIRVAEINARIRDEERRSAKEVEKITDERAAEQLRIGQATANSQLRIIETQTEQAKARFRSYADFRIITEEQAAKFEEQQTLRVFNAREAILRQELIDAGNSEEKRTEAQGKLNELEAERRAFIEDNGRKIAAAIRADAEHVIQFAAQIREAFQRAADVRLEAGEANLEPLRNSLLTRHQLWDAEIQFEITREEQRHDAAIAGYKDEQAQAKLRLFGPELARQQAAINAQMEAEEKLHQARLGQIATQAAEQRRQELLQVADDISSIASDIFDAIGKSSDEFWKSLKQSASNFAKQLRDELFKGLLEKLITGQAQGAEGLVGLIINPLLKTTGANAAVADNTKATRDNTAALNALTQSMGGTAPIPGLSSVAGGLSGVLQFIPGLFGGHRAGGGPAEAGKVYRVHENEVFFRPNVSGQILNLSHLKAFGNQGDEVRVNVAVGQDAVDELVESHMRTPKGRRAALLRAKANRKVGRLLFA